MQFIAIIRRTHLTSSSAIQRLGFQAKSEVDESQQRAPFNLEFIFYELCVSLLCGSLK